MGVVWERKGIADVNQSQPLTGRLAGPGAPVLPGTASQAVPARPGVSWCFLRQHGAVSQILLQLGKSCRVLAHPDAFWRILAHSVPFWCILAHPAKPSSILVQSDVFR